jgi:phenylpyruvate tautomerase PptA (4-oxalocrotonate tautomerase family)
MPIVIIETWPMKDEQKPGLIRKITEVFTEMGDACPGSDHRYS